VSVSNVASALPEPELVLGGTSLLPPAFRLQFDRLGVSDCPKTERERNNHCTRQVPRFLHGIILP
jgi:hypothetical protein